LASVIVIPNSKLDSGTVSRITIAAR
jgi:hypothetical protein